ncbi:MAG: peptidoglycan DD-metalloendopeptidase family protein [Oscillospiraceae bacterium]|nr:peptidoglycan DD-metalloendopeptidase family protein [Oscillospiraceae bacterium]
MKKKIISVFLSAVIAMGVWFAFGTNINEMGVVSATDSISELEQKQAELEKQNEKYQKSLDKTAKEIQKQKEYQLALTGKIDTVNEQIITSQEKIDTLNTQIDAKTKKINKLNKAIEKRMNTLRSRIKTIYMSGDVSSLEVILGAKDFSDFLDKVELVRNVSNFDEKLIKGIESDMVTVKAEKKALQSDKKKQVKEKAVLQNKRDEIQILIDENTEVLEKLYTRNKAQEAAIRKNKGALNGIDDQITKYYEELARRQAAQQQQNSNNGGGTTVVVPSGNGYCWPVPGFTALSSTYGEDRGSYGHGAIDISSAGIMGATVVAADSGTVVVSNNSCTHNWSKSGSCGCGGGYGNYVWIDHGNGKCTIYGHLTKSVVSTGQSVAKGQVIGYVGSTGWSSGPHLHFECRYNGAKYDPMSEY